MRIWRLGSLVSLVVQFVDQNAETVNTRWYENTIMQVNFTLNFDNIMYMMII